MGGVIHSIDWWWQYFKSLFHVKNITVTGTITLTAGTYELSVPSDFQNPSAVYLSVTEPPDVVSTCIGDLNWTAARLAENGFILYAKIQSASCTINYIIEYDIDHIHPHDFN